jgi:light-regulated signal transduction histidine kinase (bacteriophytochrome)
MDLPLPNSVLVTQSQIQVTRLSSATDSAILLSEKYEYAVEGRDGHGIVQSSNRKFQRCEDEPIHIPGAIQSFGFLVAIEVGDKDKLRVRIASDNSQALCSYTPVELFEMENRLDIFPDRHRAVFEEKARYVQYQYRNSSHTAEPVVFHTLIRSRENVNQPLCCALHIVQQDPPLLVCEFERRMATKEFDPDLPPHSLKHRDSDKSDISMDARAKSKLLELQRLVNNLQQDEGSTTETVNVMAHIQQRFTSCHTIQELMDSIVIVVQQLTSFHRVMVYQFDKDFNGKVAAEIMTLNENLQMYAGLHFPAGDIPPQARKMYQLNKFRLLYDREASTARLVYCSKDEHATALDLTYSYLRAMSPVHIKYLENMGVRSTASISLNINGSLWGLISCHAYGQTGTNVSFSVREVCYWIGLCASNCIENIVSRARLENRIAFDTIQANYPPQDCFTASSSDILKLLDANSGFIVIQGNVRTIGKHKVNREAFLLLQYISICNFDKVVSTNNLAKDYPKFTYAAALSSIAGFLFIPISSSSDYLLFLRGHQKLEVHWAGNPQEKMTFTGSSLLQPRASFEKWTEVVMGTSREWNDVECKEMRVLLCSLRLAAAAAADKSQRSNSACGIQQVH